MMIMIIIILAIDRALSLSGAHVVHRALQVAVALGNVNVKLRNARQVGVALWGSGWLSLREGAGEALLHGGEHLSADLVAGDCGSHLWLSAGNIFTGGTDAVWFAQ